MTTVMVGRLPKQIRQSIRIAMAHLIIAGGRGWCPEPDFGKYADVEKGCDWDARVSDVAPQILGGHAGIAGGSTVGLREAGCSPVRHHHAIATGWGGSDVAHGARARRRNGPM